MDVINETDDDVVYEVDDGGPPGGDDPRDHVSAQDRQWCHPNGKACAGYLGPEEEHTGVLHHPLNKLNLRFYDKTGSQQLAAAGSLPASSRQALKEPVPGTYKIDSPTQPLPAPALGAADPEGSKIQTSRSGEFG